eukprot:6426725-Prymnesium_polylepis.1
MAHLQDGERITHVGVTAPVVAHALRGAVVRAVARQAAAVRRKVIPRKASGGEGERDAAAQARPPQHERGAAAQPLAGAREARVERQVVEPRGGPDVQPAEGARDEGDRDEPPHLQVVAAVGGAQW